MIILTSVSWQWAVISTPVIQTQIRSFEIYEISFKISSQDSHRSSGPNSIPWKILKPMAKVIPMHKKQSKVDYKNYRPISILSNTEKIIEKLMYKRLSNFLDISNLIYSLQLALDKSTQLPML